MTSLHYLIQSTSDLAGAPRDWLTIAEAATHERLRSEKRKSDWQLGRWTAKRALVLHRALGLEEHELARLEIRAASDGAPEAFLDGSTLPVSISLTHSGDRALCALAPERAALGCDLERIEPRSAAFVETFFTADELDLYRKAREPERPLMATLIWSAKECALKLLRQGLRVDTRSVEVLLHLRLDADWQPLEIRQADTGRVFNGWWRAAGSFVTTFAADPAPRLPVLLSAD